MTETLTSQLRDALTVLGSISLAVVGIVLVAGVLPETLGNPADWILEIVTLPIVLAATMYPMYYRFPDVPLSPLEVLPGVAFAAIAWSLLVGVFQLYAMSASQFELYGILGGALLLVTWLYFAAIVIILGGVLNAVLAGRVGDALDDSTDRVRADGGDDGPSDARDTDIERLEVELDELRRRVEEKTVDRESLETDLQRYIRRRLRSGHARGWGPYLVLLYGVIMTIAAFVYLSGGWAVLAMIIIWLSTLGLYVLMLIVGVVIRAVGVPGELRDWLQQRRE